MKVLLIHTDGYSIDVVGKYNTKEEACKQLNFEYERKIEYQEMFSNGIDSEWMKSSHCDNEEAILYINGEEVHVWHLEIISIVVIRIIQILWKKLSKKYQKKSKAKKGLLNH